MEEALQRFVADEDVARGSIQILSFLATRQEEARCLRFRHVDWMVLTQTGGREACQTAESVEIEDQRQITKSKKAKSKGMFLLPLQTGVQTRGIFVKIPLGANFVLRRSFHYGSQIGQLQQSDHYPS